MPSTIRHHHHHHRYYHHVKVYDISGKLSAVNHTKGQLCIPTDATFEDYLALQVRRVAGWRWLAGVGGCPFFSLLKHCSS